MTRHGRKNAPATGIDPVRWMSAMGSLAARQLFASRRPEADIPLPAHLLPAKGTLSAAPVFDCSQSSVKPLAEEPSSSCWAFWTNAFVLSCSWLDQKGIHRVLGCLNKVPRSHLRPHSIAANDPPSTVARDYALEKFGAAYEELHASCLDRALYDAHSGETAIAPHRNAR